MPSVSKNQQKFMGIVRSIQKGEQPAGKFSKDAQKAAKKMKKSSVKKYAKTKHDDLPTKKIKEGAYKSATKNELAQYIINLNNMLAVAKSKKMTNHIKFIQQDIKDVKKALSKKKNESVNEAERDYKDEYKKFQSSTKSKKYRAELNKYNRQKGTYGNGDGKDASHKGGKIVGFESQSKNRGRAEKSRLKKESRNKELTEKDLMNFLMKRFKFNKKKAIDTMKKAGFDTSMLKKEDIRQEIEEYVDGILDGMGDEFMVNEDKECMCEACWKGYTQKGMKTMFGKKYPNCVKKTKKEGVTEAKIQVKGVGTYDDKTLYKKILDMTRSLQSLAKRGQWSKSSENSIKMLGRLWGAYSDYVRNNESVNEGPDRDLFKKLGKIQNDIYKLLNNYKSKANVPAISRSFMIGLQNQLKKDKMIESKTSDMMKAVRKGGTSGPWDIIISKNNKIVKRVSVKNLKEIPAEMSDVKKAFPNHKIGIESKGGKIVYRESIDEGSCGYGIDGQLGSEPAGPHLMKKKKKKKDEVSLGGRMSKKISKHRGTRNSADAKKVEKLLLKYGNTKKDVADMMKKYDYVSKTYRRATPAKKAEILSSLRESVNESGMELKKLEDAIKMFQKKIEKQGRVTNARDEDHLKNLIKIYKQMGGKKIKEAVKLRGKSKGTISHVGMPKASKGVEKLFKIADSGFGKVGGQTVDSMSANLFKQIYDKASDDIKMKLNKKNEKQLVMIISKMWNKFGKNVSIGSSI